MNKLVFIIFFLFLLFYVTRKKQNKLNKKPILKNIKKDKKKKTKKIKYKKILKPEIKREIEDLVFFEITYDNQIIGKIIIKLYSKYVPETCNNFRTLCINKKNLSYKGSPFHRIIKDFMIQGGDFTRGDGTGGVSIFGDRFPDENFIFKHDRPYLLSMANAGPNTNGSQFFITTTETPHLNNKHVVFGEVVEGFDLVDYLNNVETGENDRPNASIYISDCGTL